MIIFRHRGSFNNTERFFKNAMHLRVRAILDSYGRQGVAALAASTPIDSGLTASSWGYEITVSHNNYTISWTNSNINNGVPIAIILQYGHGTGNGGYVEGRDYINPAIRPIFDKIVEKIWEEVSNL